MTGEGQQKKKTQIKDLSPEYRFHSTLYFNHRDNISHVIHGVIIAMVVTYMGDMKTKCKVLKNFIRPTLKFGGRVSNRVVFLVQIVGDLIGCVLPGGGGGGGGVFRSRRLKKKKN